MGPADRSVFVTGPAGIGRIPSAVRSTARWIYLGKDVTQRSRTERWLNPLNRWEAEELFHSIADATRQPFLDFVSGIGAHQPDPVLWWSTSLSWKMWESCDLFLLIVYLKLAERIIQQTPEGEPSPTLLVVEDPWLYRQLKENQRRLRRPPTFTASGGLTGLKIRALCLGAIRRLAWAYRTLRDLKRQKQATPAGSTLVPQRPAVALYSFPIQASLIGADGWADPYLPGLDRLLETLGYDVIRFSAPDRRGFEQDLGKRHRIFQPLILHATARGFWHSLTTFWRPRWPEVLSLGGLPIDRLIQREWWLELNRSSLSSNRMFYECLRQMLSKGPWRWVIFPYENQPWEKLAVLSARERGIRSAGIQMAVFSRYYLPYSLGAGEREIHPLPDALCAAGPRWRQTPEEGGVPLDRLVFSGNIRYPHLTGSNAPPAHDRTPRNLSSEILVVLPIDPCLAGHLLAALGAAFPDGGASEGLHFRIRPHPRCPVDPVRFGFPGSTLSSSGLIDLQEALQNCGLVLFSGSMAGLEALAAGRKVLRYRSSALLDVDEFYGDRVPVCSDRTLRQAVRAQIDSDAPNPSAHEIQSFLSQLFSPLNRGALEHLFVLPENQTRPVPISLEKTRDELSMVK